MELNEIGNRIKAIMKYRQIKRIYLAKKLNISYNSLTKKLNGQREFGISELLKMRIILDVEPSVYGNILFNEKFLSKQYFVNEKNV